MKPLRLTEEAVQFAHVKDRSLRPSLFLDDRLDFFPEGLYILRTVINHEDTMEFSMHDLLSQQLIKGECEGL